MSFLPAWVYDNGHAALLVLTQIAAAAAGSNPHLRKVPWECASRYYPCFFANASLLCNSSHLSGFLRNFSK
jgi:hypothetical protein